MKSATLPELLIFCGISLLTIPLMAQETLLPLPPGTRPAPPSPITQNTEGHVIAYDAKIAAQSATGEKVGSPRIIHRTPLFSNLPFLKLKKGDQLAIGKPWSKGGKGVKPNFVKNDEYFLLSNGKYFGLRVSEAKDGLKLWHAEDSLRFDWDVNLKNAKQLAHHYRRRDSSQFSLKQYQAMRVALRKEFPETLREDKGLTIQPVTWDARNKRAIFEGLAFDQYSGAYKYQLTIGADAFRERSRLLIVGPPRVERWEFEGLKGGYMINGPAPYHPTPQIVAHKRKKYERMLAFRRIVASFLPGPYRSQLLSLRD